MARVAPIVPPRVTPTTTIAEPSRGASVPLPNASSFPFGEKAGQIFQSSPLSLPATSLGRPPALMMNTSLPDPL
jgi:hypothetical protein